MLQKELNRNKILNTTLNVFVCISLIILGCVFFHINSINAKATSMVINKGGITKIINQDIQEPINIELNPEPNEEIGSLYFPKAEMRVPIVYGYNADYMDQYFDVVGLESWNNFPGQNNKLYINGHRHLAFQNLKYVEKDDVMVISMSYGEFTYQVTTEPIVVEATDKEAIAFYRNDHDTEFTPQILRLQTCYPFPAGSTLDHRYLVDLVLIEAVYYDGL